MNNAACPLLHTFFYVSLLLLERRHRLLSAVLFLLFSASSKKYYLIIHFFHFDHPFAVPYDDWFCLHVWRHTFVYQFITVIVNKFIYCPCDALFVYTLFASISTHKLFKEFMSIDASISKMNENKIARTILLAYTSLIACFRFKCDWKFRCDLSFNRMLLKVISISIEFRLFSIFFYWSLAQHRIMIIKPQANRQAIFLLFQLNLLYAETTQFNQIMSLLLCFRFVFDFHHLGAFILTQIQLFQSNNIHVWCVLLLNYIAKKEIKKSMSRNWYCCYMIVSFVSTMINSYHRWNKVVQ